MVMSPTGLGTKNHCDREGQQHCTSQSVIKGLISEPGVHVDQNFLRWTKFSADVDIKLERNSLDFKFPWR
jgi:hypothetical protein